ncbi:hypothetical protein ES703_10221 [subsurface metagenome]
MYWDEIRLKDFLYSNILLILVGIFSLGFGLGLLL